MNLEVQPARPDDLEPMLEWRGHSEAMHQAIRGEFEAHAQKQRTILIAFNPEGTQVGTVQLIQQHTDADLADDKTACLQALEVRSDHQRQGIGTALIRAFEEQARRLGYSRATLMVEPDNAPAMALYMKLGFKVFKQSLDTWDGKMYPVLCLEKHLEPMLGGERVLVLITGPVGGGKSTTAKLMAAELRCSGLMAAVIDLDEMYGMARQQPGFGDRQTWAIARRAAAALTESFYASGIRAVIVEGGFLSAHEYAELRGYVTSPVKDVFFTLLVSEAEALRRAQHDPDPARMISRRPDVQAVLYEEFRNALPFLQEVSIVVEASASSPESVAKQLAETVLEGHEGVP